jgi:TPR repeat protein
MSKKKDSLGDDSCGHCGIRSKKLFSCARCELVKYCCKDCQAAAWEVHRPRCISKEDRKPQPLPPPSPQSGKSTPISLLAGRTKPLGAATSEINTCAICLDEMNMDAITPLPCGHSFHGSCVEAIRTFGLSKVCPMCRGALPEGPEKMWDEACRRWFLLVNKVDLGKAKWGALVKADRREMKEVEGMFLELANQGHAHAAAQLGTMFESGKGVKINMVESFKWNCLGAANGNMFAQHNVGRVYELGLLADVKIDLVEASKWYLKAAEQGVMLSQLAVGNFIIRGIGGPWQGSRETEAYKWWVKAAEQGHPQAQYSVGQCLVSGIGTERNLKEGFIWLQKSAAQGQAEGLNCLAMFYNPTHEWQNPKHDDFKVKKSITKALDLLKNAMKKGHHPAKAPYVILLASSRLGKYAENCDSCDKKNALLFCSRCKGTSYCNRACQVDHWKKGGHKETCVEVGV